MARPRAALVAAAALVATAASVGAGAMATTGGGAAPAGQQRAAQRWPGPTVGSVGQAERLAAADQAAAARSGGAAQRAGQTLIFVTRQVRAVDVDLPPAGFGPGDFFMFEENVFDRSGRRQVGRDAVTCQVGLRTITCEATFQISGKGKIEVAGAQFSERDNVFPITGGTGAYQGVGGDLSFFGLGGNRAALVLHLVR